MDIIVKNCRVCALGIKVEPEGTILCYKFKRELPPEESVRYWGCFYFAQIMPGEDYDIYQYLLIKETEMAERK
jgi:hypothetical protein